MRLSERTLNLAPMRSRGTRDDSGEVMESRLAPKAPQYLPLAGRSRAQRAGGGSTQRSRAAPTPTLPARAPPGEGATTSPEVGRYRGAVKYPSRRRAVARRARDLVAALCAAGAEELREVVRAGMRIGDAPAQLHGASAARAARRRERTCVVRQFSQVEPHGCLLHRRARKRQSLFGKKPPLRAAVEPRPAGGRDVAGWNDTTVACRRGRECDAHHVWYDCGAPPARPSAGRPPGSQAGEVGVTPHRRHPGRRAPRARLDRAPRWCRAAG